MNNEKIGNNIKKWRKLKKLTQQELGEKIDKTLSSIQKYEKGNVMIPIDVLSNIAKALNIGIDKLIYENGGFSNKIENNIDRYYTDGFIEKIKEQIGYYGSEYIEPLNTAQRLVWEKWKEENIDKK